MVGSVAQFGSRDDGGGRWHARMGVIAWMGRTVLLSLPIFTDFLWEGRIYPGSGDGRWEGAMGYREIHLMRQVLDDVMGESDVNMSAAGN